MTRTAMKRNIKNIIEGTIIFSIGLVIGIAYLFKFFPLDPVKNFAILAVWSYTGWMIALLLILYGLCKIIIDGNLDRVCKIILRGNL